MTTLAAPFIRMCSIVAQAMCRSACDNMCLSRVEGAHTLEIDVLIAPGFACERALKALWPATELVLKNEVDCEQLIAHMADSPESSARSLNDHLS